MAKKTGKEMSCENCSRLVYVPRWRQRSFRFCSNFCQGFFIINKRGYKIPRIKRPHFKGGSVTEHGYKVVYENGKQVYEHRSVMEEHLGRKLKPGENIHHINGIRTDNRIDNLELFEDRSAHTQKYHLKGVNF